MDRGPRDSSTLTRPFITQLLCDGHIFSRVLLLLWSSAQSGLPDKARAASCKRQTNFLSGKLLPDSPATQPGAPASSVCRGLGPEEQGSRFRRELQGVLVAEKVPGPAQGTLEQGVESSNAQKGAGIPFLPPQLLMSVLLFQFCVLK